MAAVSVVDVTGGIAGKLATAVGLVRDMHGLLLQCHSDTHRAVAAVPFVVSVSGPSEGSVLAVLFNPDAPLNAVLATKATHIYWQPTL